MVKQLELDWNAKEAESRRDEAIERVDKHGDEEWKDRALAAIDKAGLSGLRFLIAEDVLRWVGRPPVDSDPRVLGAVIRRAAARGFIEPTQDFRPGDSVTRHRAPCRVWRVMPPGTRTEK